MGRAYYNEIDPFAAAWLRELIKAGHIAPGDVDERSIEDVAPDDLAGYTQCHFFAGIGGWPYALRLAGWPDDRPVWTGSAPCQPFSQAGQRKGYDDERHLAPVWLRLIEQHRPASLFGEQVASADGRNWLSDLRLEMEALGYAFGAADLCAAGAGAPHIRQRLIFGAVLGDRAAVAGADRTAADGWLADGDSGQRNGFTEFRRTERDGPNSGRTQGIRRLASCGEVVGLADFPISGWREERQDCCGIAFGDHAQRITAGLGASVGHSRSGTPDEFWRDADWLGCRDGSWRPVEPGTFPLDHGIPARVGRLRGYGNAIVPQVCAIFIQEFQGAVREAAA